MSTVLILILQMPCLDISCTCKKTRVSASSCVQGTVKLVLYGWLQITVSSKAHIINLLSSKFLIMMTFERKRNNSDLFSSIRRKAFQLFGGCELFSTFLLIPLPRFFHFAAFKLYFLYVSNIMSTRSNLVISFLIATEKISSAYSNLWTVLNY